MGNSLQKMIYYKLIGHKTSSTMPTFSLIFCFLALALTTAIAATTAATTVPIVDIREVVVDPTKYAGRELASQVYFEGIPVSGLGKDLGWGFRGIGSDSNSRILFLIPDKVRKKTDRVYTVVGQYNYIIIVYRVWSNAEKSDIEAWNKKFLVTSQKLIQRPTTRILSELTKSKMIKFQTNPYPGHYSLVTT